MNAKLSTLLAGCLLLLCAGCSGVFEEPLLSITPLDSGVPVDVEPDGGVAPDGGVPDAGTPDGGTVRLTTTGSLRYGINVDSALDYWPNRMFADAIKESRGWFANGTSGRTSVAVDTNGWPTGDATVLVFAGLARANGTYGLSFNGQASVDCCGAGSVSTVHYDAATNLSTATVTYSDATASGGMYLQFTNTHRTAQSGANTGVTNVKLMRPTAPGATTSIAPTLTFTPVFTSTLAPFSVLRFMDYFATNGSLDVNWSDRVAATYATMQRYPASNQPQYGWQGKGGAYAFAFQLCNETAKDCWINIPATANDDFVNHVATLAKSMLNPGLHLYVEYSNEVWNGSFAAAGQAYDAAQAEVGTGHSALNFDGETNTYFLSWRRYTERSVQISVIFRTVFGDADMMTRVRPVLEAQLGSADGPLLQQLILLQSYYANGEYVATPHPASYYFYGGGGSAYYNATSDQTDTVSHLLASMTNPSVFISAVQRDTDYLKVLGLRHVAYEGGPSLDRSGNSSTDTVQENAHNDPGIVNVVTTNQTTWEQNGGDLLVYFNLTGDFQWGFMDDVLDHATPPTSYKYQATLNMQNQPAATSNYGTALPATLAGSAYQVPPSWSVPRQTGSFGAGDWFGWTVKAPTAGTFHFALSAGCATAAGKVELWVDGALVNTFALASTGSLSTDATTQPFAVQLTQGTHGIMIRGAHGTATVSLQSVIVTQ